MKKAAVVLILLILWIFMTLPFKVSISFDLERDPPLAMEGRTTFRGVNRVPEILGLLERHDTKATFFVTGRVVDRFPSLLNEIGSRGHEIGVHGAFYHDERLKGLSVAEQKEKIGSTAASIQNLTGRAPEGYRAPGHLFDENTILALHDLNFTYDSSAVPSVGGWYLYGHSLYTPAHPYFHGETGILEIPITPVLFDGNLDSLLAYQGTLLTKIELSWAVLKAKVGGAPLVLYLHPGMMTDLENSPKNYRASTSRVHQFEEILSFLDLFNPRYTTLEETARDFSLET